VTDVPTWPANSSSAVGVPPQWVVEKLHKNKIVVASVIGHPKHCVNVLKAQVDMVIFQGAEGEYLLFLRYPAV
jgi:NAD(P)H-dependent flavin oxidoreductase YrpB (nitropropane dioxygenase family)